MSQSCIRGLLWDGTEMWGCKSLTKCDKPQEYISPLCPRETGPKIAAAFGGLSTLLSIALTEQ
jgi:hypothetical protein